MSKPILALLAILSLASCGSWQKRPELAKMLENDAATWQVDILPGGHGSGAVIHEDGYILTCHHMAGDGERKLRITIAENGGPPLAYEALVMVTDAKLDLAVLKVNRTFTHPVAVAKAESAFPGDNVYNIGYPYGYGKLVGRGHIARTHYNLTQGDFSIVNGLAVALTPAGPGSSGSAIFAAANGEMLGIVKYMLTSQLPGYGPTSFFIATGPDDVRAFLDKNHVPYHSPGDQDAWYLNVSAPDAPYQIDIVPPQH